MAPPLGPESADRPRWRRRGDARAGGASCRTGRRLARGAAEVRRRRRREAAGYTSIGDAGTGSEHYIRLDLVQDDVLLDPTQPESLVYTVDGDERILAGAMCTSPALANLNDPELLDFAGPLMQWHNHGNLCWDRVNGVAQVVGLVDETGTCKRGG